MMQRSFLRFECLAAIGVLVLIPKPSAPGQETLDTSALIATFENRSRCVSCAAETMRVDLSTLPLPDFYFSDSVFDIEKWNENQKEGAFVFGISTVGKHPKVRMNVYFDEFTSTTVTLSRPEQYRFGGGLHRHLAAQCNPEIASAFEDPFDSSRALVPMYLDSEVAIVSVGPDKVENLNRSALNTIDDLLAKIDCVYDPTNGIQSQGDLIFPSTLLGGALKGEIR